MADTTFDVLLRFMTEMVGEDSAKQFSESVEDLKKQIDDSNKKLTQQNGILKEWKTKLRELKTELDSVRKGGAVYKQIKTEMAALTEAIANGTDEVKENEQAHRKLIEQLRAEERQQKNLQQTAMRSIGIMTRAASTLQGISNTLVVGGTAVAGGLFKAAKDFVDNAEEQTALTKAWKKETDDIAASYQLIGQVAASEILPFLTKAAAIADKIAGFAQQNPGAVGAAVEIGVVGLAIGVIGKAVASGIKLVADITYLAATASQLLAANEMLLSAGGMQVAATTFATTVGVILLPALVILAGILSGVLVGLMAYEAIAQNSGGKLPDLETIGTQALTILKAKTQEIWDEFTRGADKASIAVQKFGENTDKLLDAFAKFRDAEAAENERYQTERAKIIERSNADAIKSAQQSADKIKKINDKAAGDRDSIIANFTKRSAEDLEKYEKERANIIRDGGLEIERIEQNRLEKLRQLEMEHSDRVDDLAANRDALGLVLEQRKFDRDRQEIDRATNIEIAQRRQDLAIRLEDLAANFAAEREKKQEQFIEDLKINEANRAQAVKEEKDAELVRQKDIRAKRAQDIKELDQQHKEELKRNREAFLAQIRDLDASLLGEQNRKKQAYSKMLADLDLFLAQERAKKNSRVTGAAPGYAAGGYTPDGIIRSHSNEFIASRSTARSLESMIGGRLTQQNLVAAVAGGESLTVNTRSRFDGTYTNSMKRQVEQDTFGAIMLAFKNKNRRR